jgi:hypothetical protein
MSESEYYDDWVADGKPWRNARPVDEIVTKLKAARPAAAKAGCFGTIGDLPHLLADTPQDHTPYSQTGWPLVHPYPRITATDIMHRPDLGVDCNEIHQHWLASAKAGQIKWIKYWIWQGRRYDVRNNFNPVSASGHYDHLHGSQRTDHIETSIGGWHPLPGTGDDEMQFMAQLAGSQACWLSNGLKCRPIAAYPTLQWYMAQYGLKLHVFANDAEFADRAGEKDFAGPDPITLNAEQMAAIAAAAAKGAEQGVINSADELAAELPTAAEIADEVVAEIAS